MKTTMMSDWHGQFATFLYGQSVGAQWYLSSLHEVLDSLLIDYYDTGGTVSEEIDQHVMKFYGWISRAFEYYTTEGYPPCEERMSAKALMAFSAGFMSGKWAVLNTAIPKVYKFVIPGKVKSAMVNWIAQEFQKPRPRQRKLDRFRYARRQ